MRVAGTEPPRKGFRTPLTFALHVFYGALVAFVGVAAVLDLVPGDSLEDPLGTTGFVVTGVALIALAATFIGLTEFGVLRRHWVLSAAGVGSFLASLGMTLVSGLNFWPVAVSALAVGVGIGLIRVLRRRS